MSKSRLEWKVGLFVLIGLVLLGVLMLEFSKGLTLLQPTYKIYLHAPNVGGLQVRAQVLMSGVEVGKVSNIQLAPDSRSVIITLRILIQFVIHKDARFVIEQAGFLGDKYVAIMPTANEEGVFHNGGMAQAEAPFDLQEFTRTASGFLARIDQTVKSLNEALVDIRQTLLNPETLTNLSTSVANLRVVSDRARQTVDNLNDLMTNNSPVVAQSVTNLAAFSQNINQFSDGLNNLLATNSANVHAAVANIEASTDALKQLLAEVQAGKGLAGELIKNEKIAANVSEITQNLSITSSNLNRLGLWGILWSHKPRKSEPAPPPERLTSPKGSDM